MAAGQGFKTFTTGEVLTAGDVNGYLMQGINVFASEAARDAAITAPAEGQFAYTKDNNSLWYYTGSAWAASGATGDIEGVTAGVGISGGGTSGTVTITNSMATAIDAKGDLVAGTAADTFSRLAVGANDTILTADSSTATGLKWAAPAAGATIKTVRKSTDESVSNSTSVINDSQLKFAVEANATYIFQLWIYPTAANATPCLTYGVTGPSGSTLFWSPPDFYVSAGGGANATVVAGGGTLSHYVDSFGRPALVFGTIVNGSTAGDVQFVWAQNTSSATATTVKAGSSIQGIKVA